VARRPFRIDLKYFVEPILSKTEEYLKKYNLCKTLLLLLLDGDYLTFLDNLMFPNLGTRIAQEFNDFQYSALAYTPRSNIYNPTEKDKYIMEFCDFVVRFGTVLDRLTTEQKKSYLKRFYQICKKTATAFDKIKDFYFKIKIFQEFCLKKGFKLKSIPEIKDRKNKVPDC
jgi:hypothetical protein